ncbi:MAG: hypothetical protein IJ026_06395 [Candidatus Methanomethylophilaceae archaeon]|nr:hypothetical protein [Candidatus Methanomethylophilaceae archaeon]
MADTVPDEVADGLTALQRRVVDNGAKVLLLIEGRSGRVIGRAVNELMNLLEPRGTTYTHFVPHRPEDPRDAMAFMNAEPADGVIALYDRSWYAAAMVSHMGGGDADRSVEYILALERYLVDNGVVLVKVFLDVDEDDIDEVGGRFGSGAAAGGTFLTDDHIGRKGFDRRFMRRLMEATGTDHAPWDVVGADDISGTVTELAGILLRRVSVGIDDPPAPSGAGIRELYPNPREHADLTLTARGYRSELARLSGRLHVLQERLAASDRSLVLVFEGWDAAGKGGTIRRVTRALNPRGYRAIPVAAPVGDERVHTYLWRFTGSLPSRGHVTIYDRSWYGRMMVEPIEGFCTPDEYARSASEINGFERAITDSGGIVLKFWMEISPEEQLRRFEARRDDPLKSWKITDEDWRNRARWDEYCEHIDRMIASTNTPSAPWTVVESEDKKHGRLKVLRTIVEALEAVLE